MNTIPSQEFYQLENWLQVLTKTYADYPSNALAKVILYYLSRIIHHDDALLMPEKQCDYISMQKFWHWQSRNKF